MSTKTYQVRLHCNREELAHLWRTHVVFQERLRILVGHLFRMLKGEAGRTPEEAELYRTIAHFILQTAKGGSKMYLFNSVAMSSRDWTPTTACGLQAQVDETKVSGNEWAERARELQCGRQLLFNFDDLLGDLESAGAIKEQLCVEASATVSSYRELRERWGKEHREWQTAKSDWESKPDHARYLQLRPGFLEFERERGSAGRRRGRWSAYREWLVANPDLAAWRGGPAQVHEVAPGELEKIRRMRPNKRAGAEVRAFFEANSELRALDRLHGFYERHFAPPRESRGRKQGRRRHHDGFKNPPTFTQPGPVSHPRWMTFKRDNGYKKLCLPSARAAMGAIELQLVTGDKCDGVHPVSRVSLRFKADPRLAMFREVTVQRKSRSRAQRGEQVDTTGLEFFDKHLGLWRPAKIGGARLIFRNIELSADGALRRADPYLSFTVEVKSLPLSDRAKAIKWVEPMDGGGKKQVTIPEGLVTCAVDLGMRNVGFATLATSTSEGPRILASVMLGTGHVEQTGRHVGRVQRGPTLRGVAANKRKLRNLRRKRGKPVKGEESNVTLQAHVTNISDDYFKRAARTIVNYALGAGAPALRPRADVLLLEKLEGLVPDSERERGINSAMAAWNRAGIVKFVEEMAKDAGLRVHQLHPYGTSQVCSKCGRVGRRYSIECERDGLAEIRFGILGKLFGCAHCGYRANADHNASVNLHRKFHDSRGAMADFARFRALSDAGRAGELHEIEAALTAGRILEKPYREGLRVRSLRQMHGLVLSEDISR